MKTKPKCTRKGNKADGRRVGCCKSEGLQGVSMESHSPRQKTRNFFNIYSTDSLMCTSEVPGMELRTVEDTKTNKIQPVEGEFAV